MKSIYVVLAHTGTILSRMIRIRTRDEYTHASIALDEDLNKMYSFGRKNPYIAFIGGFVREGATFGTFKRFYKTEISIYEIEVLDEQYQKICEKIAYIKKHKKEYRFNVLGLFWAAFNKKLEIEKTFYCAQFVKAMLNYADIDTSNLPEVIKPEDFKKLKNSKMIYKGKLKDYKFDKLKEYIVESLKVKQEV